ncbi:MAG: NUDIX domain-containing protein [Candidatus Nanoarchaeia archaeon]
MDEKTHYVVATAILVADGKFLIAKRSEDEKSFPGLWTVPGGRLEMSEYTSRPNDAGSLWYNVVEDLVRREVKEEVNLDIGPVKYLTSCSFIRPNGMPTVIMSFFTETHDGELKLSDELVDHAWVTLEEAKRYKLIDGIYDELVMLDKHLKGEEVTWSRLS